MSKTESIFRTMLVYAQYKNIENKDINENLITTILTDLMLLSDEYAVDFSKALLEAKEKITINKE
tara:strand:+ start:22 stop:216 length:195 start_codon:yes stop_codon:yes gene_type:complete